MGEIRGSKVIRSGFWAGLAALGLVASANAQSTLAITTQAFPQAVVGAPYSLQLAATGGTSPYTWGVQPAIVTLPVPGQISPGIQLDSKSGLASGTPTQAGNFSFTITLTDSANNQFSKVYSLTVSPAGPLGITTASLPQGTVGVKYSQQLGAAGGTPPYKWSVASGTLPAGLILDGPTGLVGGTPSSAGASTVTFGLSDSASTPGSARQAITITIVNPPPIAITNASLKGGYVNAPYQDQVVASGGVPPYKYSIASGSLPTGLSLDSNTGFVSGKPGTAGTSSVTVRVADSGLLNAQATQAYSIVIAPLTPVTVSAATLATATAGTPYSSSMIANGGAPAYTWSVVTGAVPPGLVLNSAGSLQGVPSAPGTFTFNAQAADTAGQSGAGYFTVTVNPASVSLPADTPPAGMVGVPFPPQVLAPAGGIGPYTLSVTAGSLPTGLALVDGRLQGTPTVAGSFNFTVSVTDSNSPPQTAGVQFQLTIRPAQTDLALSTASMAFVLTSGTPALPGSQNVVVSSTSAATAATFSVSVTPAAPWLTVSGGANGTTPTSYTVSLNSAALALAAAGSPYKTAIVFTCVTPAACAGYSPQSVAVSLAVSAPPPQLQLTKQIVSLTAIGSGLVTGSFGVQNAGGGAIAVTSASAADGWLAVSGLANTIAAGAVSFGTITVNPAGFQPGYYRTNLTIVTSAGTAILPVTVLVASNAFITLNPGGQLFQMTSGGAVGNPNGLFAVTVQGNSTVNWSAALLPGAPWISLKTTSGSSTAATPGTISFSIDPAASAVLAAKVYYATIRVTSSQTANSPQDFLVVLNVGASSDPVTIEPAPGGLVFLAAGPGAVAPQTVQVFAGSASATAYQAAAATQSGKSWLSVTPVSGSARSGAPGNATVSVNQAGLTPDIYRGTVTYSASPASVRTVNVTLIVAPVISSIPLSSVGAQAARPNALSCTPTSLVPTSSFASDFSQPVAWPVPIVIQLADNCGTVIGNGQVEVTFPTSVDPPLALKADAANAGRYFGTWIPRKAASQIAVGVTATAPGLPPATVQITGKVLPNSVPVLTPAGTSNVFSGAPGGAAPGTAVQIYGSYLAPPGTAALATSLPFPTSLAGTSVLIGGVSAPLYFVSPGQINALVPLELPAGSQVQIVVNANNVPAAPDAVPVPATTPGIAAFPSGAIIAQHQADFSLVLPASPAKPGEGLIIYLAGLGAATNQPASGSGAPVPPTDPKTPVTLTINNNPAPADFVGLTPGAVGLYQINFKVPPDAPEGDLTLKVTQGATASNVTILPVRK
jgi:uncharacterized protein (TIGR03437 family)